VVSSAFAPLLGWRPAAGHATNIADVASATSRDISAEMFRIAGIPMTTVGPANPSVDLEIAVAADIEGAIQGLYPYKSWIVERRRQVSYFKQYRHLDRLQSIITADTSGTLASEIGIEYLIKPDVTVATVGSTPDSLPFLHAAVSCKWTMRSDRVQGVRHEGVILTRHRRARQPHIVCVTMEPMPSRIASLARGTGEIDALYHPMFDELVTATSRVGNESQLRDLYEMVAQGRLKAYSDLLVDFAD
jgi:hypothetical protein